MRYYSVRRAYYVVRKCSNREQYFSPHDLRCGNGQERTQHPSETFWARLGRVWDLFRDGNDNRPTSPGRVLAGAIVTSASFLRSSSWHMRSQTAVAGATQRERFG